MRKSFKLTLAVLMVLIGALLLTACEAPADVVDDDATPPPTEEVQEAEEPEEPEELDEVEEMFAARPAGTPVVVSDYDPFPTFESFQESPFLEGRGLPPVEERLPTYPKVPNTIIPGHVDVTIGQFGGELRTATPSATWNANVWSMNLEPLLNTPGILGEEITGNVLHRFEVNDDYTEFTFFLREGMRWSDGEFVTTEDVRFAVEHFAFNTELNSIPPNFLRSQSGEHAQFEVIDRYTFRLTYDVPFGGLLIRLAIRQWTGYQDLIMPSHFLSDFHIAFTDEETIMENAIARGHEEVTDWVTSFSAVNVNSWGINNPNAVGFPTLTAWMNVGNYAGQLTRFERNPYFWKVDQEGNQLPYIDTITSHHLQDTDGVTMMMIGGELDFNIFETALTNMPLYLQHAEANNYKVIMSEWHITPANVYFFHSYPDEQWQLVVNDVRFRRAVNYAFNPQEVIDIVYGGFARPSTVVDPTFDPDRAVELFEEMGMTIGADGFRTCPNGEPFQINLDFSDRTPDMAMVAELFVAFMNDVDIRVSMRTIERGVHEERQGTNEIQATVMWAEVIWYNIGEWIFRDAIGSVFFDWFLEPESDNPRPPDEIIELFQYMDNAFWLPPDEALREFGAYLESWRENVWGIQYLESVQQPIIANINLRNVDILQPTWGIGLAFGGEIFYFAD